MKRPHITPTIAAVDIFCGAGGLAYGLRQAGIRVVAGIDVDPACEYPFTANNAGARFMRADVRTLTAKTLKGLYPAGCVRLLAGCAPCQPFSPFRRGSTNHQDPKWSLLDSFGALIAGVRPELVTLENVPDVANKTVFKRLLATLKREHYEVSWRSVYCPRLGIPQSRRRIVLIASLVGLIAVPSGSVKEGDYRTVRDSIGHLPRVRSGEADARDPLHRARCVSALNMKRLRVSKPGGTWRDWPAHLRSECHRRASGSSYQNVYSRMRWDEPSPTITTLAYNFGTGRFGHPEQNRSITLREAALLQTFPRKYKFVEPGKAVRLDLVCRLIGNAVPPKLGRAVGMQLVRAVKKNWASAKV